jgi:hypothetical protein
MSSIAQTFAGLQRTPLLAEDGQSVAWQWQQGFNKLSQAVAAPASSGNVPTSSSSPGTFGQIATDGIYVYVYGLTGWGRAALSAF